MTKRILLPLPDSDYDVTEVAVPWKLLTEAGHEVVFATENPSVITAADPLLLSGVIFGQLGADPEAQHFYREMLGTPGFANSVAWSDLNPTDYDALLLPGGHAPGMRQYLGNSVLHGKIAEFWKTNRPVAAICHGVLVAARSRNEDGTSILRGFQSTCLPKYMERIAYYISAWKLGRYYRTYPAYVEDEVRAALGEARHFERGPITLSKRGTRSDDDGTFVVEDRHYISGRWPGDSYLLAKRLLDRL